MYCCWYYSIKRYCNKVYLAKYEKYSSPSFEIGANLLSPFGNNKGGKFLRKLWHCVDGEYYKIIWLYQLG